MARKLKIMENRKYTLYDVKYGEENKHDNLKEVKLKIF